MKTHGRTWALGGLFLVALLGAACKSGDARERNEPAAASSAAEASDVTFPDYPPGADGGKLWLRSKGGPLGEGTFEATPREARGDGKSFYSQSASEKRKGAAVVYTIELDKRAAGEHAVEPGIIRFYTGDGTGPDDKNFELVEGHLKIDEASTKSLRMRAIGKARERDSKELSDVELALVLAL